MVGSMNFFFKPFRLFRNGFFCLLLIVQVCSPLSGQFKFREPPNRQMPNLLDESVGQQFWNWFLSNRASGVFQFEGTLTHRPSGSASVTYDLLMRGDWRAQSQETLITLTDISGQSHSWEVDVSDGHARVVDSTGERLLDEEDWTSPVMEEFPFTWMDLLMPYFDWTDVTYIGPDRYLGRPAHRFSLSNPEPDAFPSSVTVTLDGDYAAVLKADLFDQRGLLLKRMRVGGIKKFEDGWMFSELNWENREARSSIRLKISSYRSSSL